MPNKTNGCRYRFLLSAFDVDDANGLTRHRDGPRGHLKPHTYMPQEASELPS